MGHVSTLQRIQPSLLLALGFSLILTFNGPTMALLLPNCFGEYSSLPASLAFRLAQVIGFISFAALSNKIGVLHSHTPLVSTSAIIAFTCALGMSSISLYIFDPYIQLIICTLLLAGIGATSAILFLAWIELICRKSMPHTLACFTTAYLFSNLFTMLLTTLPHVIANITGSLLPAFMLPLYLFAKSN